MHLQSETSTAPCFQLAVPTQVSALCVQSFLAVSSSFSLITALIHTVNLWSIGWHVLKDLVIWIPDLLLLFCRVKLQNVAGTQSSWRIPAISTMRCGTHRAAKCSTVTTIQTGRREITRHPKRRKGRS